MISSIFAEGSPAPPGAYAASVLDDVVLFGEKVCQPAFAFVTPVDPDNCAITHFLFPLFSCSSYEFPEERMSSVRSALEFRMILHSYIEAAARKGH